MAANAMVAEAPTDVLDGPSQSASVAVKIAPQKGGWWREGGQRLDLAVAGLLLLLAFAFMWGGLPPGRVAAPMPQLLVFPPWQRYYPDLAPRISAGDLILQQLPWREWERQELGAGRFPLWAPAPLGGLPLFADYQPGVLYPLNLLWVLMPVGAGLGIIMALKLWLAGLGMWGFLRGMGLHPVACLLTALGFMFSSWMVNLLAWQLTSVYLLLPWLAWAIYAWCIRGRLVALVAVAGLVACAIFAGHPEVLFIFGIVAVIWALGLILSSPGRSWAGKISGLAVAVVLGVGVGVVQLWPFLEALGTSHEAAVRATWPEIFSRQHLEPDLMLNWVQPRQAGHFFEGVLALAYSFTEMDGYVGLVALVGLVLAVATWVKRDVNWRLILPWVVAGLFAWLVVYGDTLGQVVRSLPGFKESVNVRWISIVAFSGLVLSAFGWDWLARRRPLALARRARSWLPRGWVGGVGLVLLVEGLCLMAAHAAGLLPLPVLTEKSSNFWLVNGNYQLYWTVWAVGVGMAVLGATVLWIAPWKGRIFAPVALGAVLLVDLWQLLLPVNVTAPTSQYFPQTSFLQQVKALVPPTERVLVDGDGFLANSALVYGIRDWRSQDALMSERAYQAAMLLDPGLAKRGWDAYNMLLRRARTEVGPMLGMRYFVLPVGADPNVPATPDSRQPQFTRLAYKDGLGLWRAEGVPGFAYLSDNVSMAADEREAWAWMKGATWERTRTYPAVVEGTGAAVSGIKREAGGGSPGSTEVTEYSPGHIVLRVSATRPALLVVAESWDVGWRARLDGVPVESLRANYLSQGIVVPAGAHTVAIEYAPASFRYGAIVSVVSLLGIVLLAVAGRWWARRQNGRTVVEAEEKI